MENFDLRSLRPRRPRKAEELNSDQKERLRKALLPSDLVPWDMPPLRVYLQWAEAQLLEFRENLDARGKPPTIDRDIDLLRHLISCLLESHDAPWHEKLNEFHVLGIEMTSLALTVLTTLDMPLHHLAWRNTKSPNNSPKWSHAHTLCHNIASQLPSPAQNPNGDIPMNFTAANLVKFYGFRIQWTAHIEQHMKRIDNHNDGTRILMIFKFGYYASILNIHTSLFPTGFHDELLDSLALLFPQNDKDTMKLLKEEHQPLVSFGHRLRRLERANYPFFHDRIDSLLSVYNGPTSHWWHFLTDRRNKKEHMTQLIAISAFVFAFLSLVSGLVSAVYAAKQYKLSGQQFELEAITAYIEHGDDGRLHKHCN